MMSTVEWHLFSERNACAQALTQTLLAQLQAQLSAESWARLLLPGGNTPEQLYSLLSQQSLDWAKVHVSVGDERWLPSEHPQRNSLALLKALPQACHLDPCAASASEKALEHWQQQLQQCLPFAAVVLGMGADGHFASLFPQMPNLAEALSLETPAGCVLGHAPVEPRLRLSGNLSLFLSTHWLGLLVFTEAKRDLLRAVQADLADTRGLPIYHLLHQDRKPVHIFWAP